MALEIIHIVDDIGTFVGDEIWLSRAEPVHRQLRDQLPSGYEAYRQTMDWVFAGGGCLCLAVDGEVVKGLAVYRILNNTIEGRRFYVDDLVVDAACRSQGVGKALINWLEARARGCKCTTLALDSGVQRSDAHRFYFREGFTIPSFCFRKKLK